ncbi:MAG TPA: TonB-dependent receptor [Fibrobacteria bacterium]|nr:TonB-dependent receptor [Fibrobacteria bacterium]
MGVLKTRGRASIACAALAAFLIGIGSARAEAEGAPDAGADADSAALELPAKTSRAARKDIASVEVKSEFIRKIPSTMNDPVRAVSFAPGVTVQNDVNIRPYVRGGSADQTRVVMNGLPLLQAYHVGGVFSLFNLNTLESVELYRDDFPVEYPGALSGVLRLKNNGRFPERAGMHADLSLVRGDAYAEVPVVKDKLSLYVASQAFLFNRSLHGLLNLASSASGDSAFREEIQGYRDHINMPDFLDFHGGASYAPSPALRVDYMGSLSGDSYAVVIPKASNIFSRINPKFGDPTAPVSPPAIPKKPDPRRKKLSIDSISSVSIDNRMHFLNLAWDSGPDNLVENDFGWQTQEWDVAFKKGTALPEPLSLYQSSRMFNYRLADTWSPSGSNRFKFGASYDYKEESYDMNLPYVLYDVVVNSNVDMLEPLGYFSGDGFSMDKQDTARSNFDYLGEYPSRIRFFHQGEIIGHTGGVFLSHTLETASGTLSYGMRGEYQSNSGEFFPAPRLDYRWKIDPRNELRFSTGLYSQGDLPFYERDRNPALKAEKSGQLGLQWTHRFTEGYRVSVDGYYKRYYDLVAPRLVPDNTIDLTGFLLPFPGSKLTAGQVADLKSILDTTTRFSALPDSIRRLSYETFGNLVFQYDNTGVGNSLGTELSFFYNPNSIWTGWLSADLSLSNRRDAEGQPYYDYRYHRPLVLNWVNYFDIRGGYDISFTYRWALGQPYTPYSGDLETTDSRDPVTVGARNSGRLSPYSRLDLRLTRNARWYRRDFKIYLEVWNSMNNPNYFARDDRTGQLKSAQLNWPFPLFFLGVAGEL